MEEPETTLVEIDPHRLDAEWIDQPRRVMEISIELADAKQRKMQVKANLDLVEAELIFAIRENPTKYLGGLKVTEALIKSAVLIQPKYQEAQRKYIRICHRVDLLGGALEALQHRKKALEDLVVLHCASYYAEPKMSEEVRTKLRSSRKQRVKRKGVRHD